MAYAYSSSVWSRVKPKITQWESLTGRDVPPSMIREWIDAELDIEANRGLQSRALDIQESYKEGILGLSREQLKSQQKAASVKGLSDIAFGGLQLYGLGKETGLWGGAKTAGTVAGAAPAIAAGGAQMGLADVLAGTAPTTTPLWTMATPAATEVAGTGATAGTAATGLTGLLPLATPAVIGVGTGMLGKAITGYGRPGHMGGERYTSAGIGLVGGAAAGFAVGGPIGLIIGGITGLIGGGK